MANELAVGQRLRLGADFFHIEAIRLDLGDIQLVGKGGAIRTLDRDALYNLISSGEIELVDYSVEAKNRSWTPCELKIAEFREGLVKILVKYEDGRYLAEKKQEEINEYCRSKGYKRPADRTVKHYIKRYKAYGFVGLIPEFSRRGGRGWEKKTESKNIAARLLHEKFMKDDKINLSDMERLTKLEIDKINGTRSAYEQLDYVDRKTISRILLEFPKSAVKNGRLDPRTFALVNRQAVTRYNIEHPFERVEIDAKTLDLYYVDEDGKPCTGLTLYAMVCAYTSYPIAIYVTAGKPSEYTLLQLLEFFFRPKDEAFKENFGIKTDWVAPCGISRIILDNASENASNLILDVVRRLGIDVEYARICRGDDKPHVESFFKSLDTRLINKLPGTTRSQDKHIKNRHNKARNEACLSVAQVYQHIVKYVADVYIHEPREKLGFKHGKPLSMKMAMDEALSRFMPIPPPSPTAVKQLLFSMFSETRKVQHYGINFQGFEFSSSEFYSLVNESSLVEVQLMFNPEDCTKIYVSHPDNGSFIELQNKTINIPEVSFETARKLKRKYLISNSTSPGYDLQKVHAEIIAQAELTPKRRTKIAANNKAVRAQERSARKSSINEQLRNRVKEPVSVTNGESDDFIKPARRKDLSHD